MNIFIPRSHYTGLVARTVTCISVLFAACSPVQAQLLPSDVKATCTTATPPEPNAPAPTPFAKWFEPAGVSPNGLVKAADSVNFPDASACSFYQWSEQMFLWLTSPTPKGLGGGDHIFLSSAFYGVSPADAKNNRTFLPQTTHQAMQFTPLLQQLGPHGLPTAFDKSGQMLEVLPPTNKMLKTSKEGKLLSAKSVLAPQLLNGSLGSNVVQSFKSNNNGGMVYLDAAGNEVDMSIGQAGGGNVLIAQNGSIVYYSIAANDLFAYFLTANKKADPNTLQFPTTAKELAAVQLYAKNKGFKELAAPEALAFEVKMAWIETKGFDEAYKKKFITIKAEVPDVDVKNPAQLKLLKGKLRKVELAMVGLHVVGSAKGNPEMIWATFEHADNAPNAEYKYYDAKGVEKTVLQNTQGKWLFSQNGANSPFNQHLYAASGTTITCTDKTKPCVVKPDNTLRWKPWGAAADQDPRQADPSHAGPVITPSESNTDIISINNSIISQLADGDVRKNYLMIGSTWTTGGRAPDTDKAPAKAINQVGTSRLANTTMETVHQGTDINWKGGTNCFSCHSTNTVSTSHIWAGLQPLPTKAGHN